MDFLGVTKESLLDGDLPSDPMASHGSFLQESRFPFTELPFDGIFGLGLGGLSACFSDGNFLADCEHLSLSFPFLSG